MENFNLYAFADEADSSLSGQIEALKQNGLRGLEIRGVDEQNISDVTKEKTHEIFEKLTENGLITWSIGSPIGKIGMDEDFAAHLEKFKHTLEIAEILKAENLRLFSFYIPSGKNPNDYKNEVIDRLGILLETAKGSGITLCHENEKGIFGELPENCLELFKALPDLGGIFDPANFIQSGADTLKAWELLKPYIRYLHIKDAKWDGTVVPAGLGDGNVATIVREFAARGGRNFTLEPHLFEFVGLKSLEHAESQSQVGHLGYKTSRDAFDDACVYFKNILNSL